MNENTINLPSCEGLDISEMFALTIKTDSLGRYDLKKGDIALIKYLEEYRDGAVAVCEIQDEFYIGEIRADGSGNAWIQFSGSEETIVLPTHKIKVYGEVAGTIRMFN